MLESAQTDIRKRPHSLPTIGSVQSRFETRNGMLGISTNRIDCGDGAIVGDNVLPVGRNQPAGDSFGSGRSNFAPIQIDEIAACAVARLVPVDGDSLSVRQKMRGATASSNNATRNSPARAQGRTFAWKSVDRGFAARTSVGVDTVWSANPRSRANWKRCSGSFSRQCRTIRSKGAGIPACSRSISGGLPAGRR